MIILTVHGTNDGAEDAEGDLWWRRGGSFEAQLNQLLRVPGGAITLEPFRWSGANSAADRRAAGCDLLARLRAGGDEPVVAIGHSHGGSVIGEALQQAAAERARLEGLRGWLTIGAPFIDQARKPFIFNRIGFFGQIAFIVLSALLARLAINVPFVASLIALGEDVDWRNLAAVSAIYAPMLAIAVVLIWGPDARGSRRLTKRARRRFVDWFEDRWTGVWDRDDEAINGLETLHTARVSLPIAPIIDELVRIAVLVAALLVAVYGSIVFLPSTLAFTNNDIARASPIYYDYGLSAPQSQIDACTDLVEQSGNAPDVAESEAWAANSCDKAVELELTRERYYNLLRGFPFVVLFFAFAAYLAVIAFARWIVLPLLTPLLNRIFNRAVRAQALGQDVRAERAKAVSPAPPGFARTSPLPDSVNADLTAATSKAAAQTLARMRRILTLRREGAADPEIARAVDDALSWDELVHTAYFSRPLVVKYIAYALCAVDGLEPSDAFVSDPDFREAKAFWEAEGRLSRH